jgi:tetratricopeptide (TPR) repeat protein
MAEPKFWAFISYSHRDARVAIALQRALETYRLPRQLVGARNAVGTVPAWLRPVFLDRGDLPAGTDLKTIVREALTHSRFLIVLCSPDAARSAWVNQEIVEFKKMHGESRVLAVIAAGEPFASRMPGREAEECFPEALRTALTPDGRPGGGELEPIAADLRPHGDGQRRAMLKLAAGMVGVGADELIRRDAQRRVRRLALVAAASVAGMAIMAVLTVTAVRSRNEAQVQRAEAEDLLEFMLGDLRRKLEPVGRLDVLDGVGEKALSYYARQEADRLDPNALGRRSRALHLIGEMREQRGQLEAALRAFTRAAETTAQLLQRAPHDPQRIFDHAQSAYWVGFLAYRRGQVAVAERAFRDYIELAQRLVLLDGRNPDWQAETAYASENIGILYLHTGRAAEALAAFIKTRQTWERIVGLRPAHAFELAGTLGWIAKAHEALGAFGEAIETQKLKIRVLHTIPGAANDKRVQRLLQSVAHDQARFELALGRLPKAAEMARTAVQQAEALVATDSQNRFWLEQLYFSQNLLAEAQAAAGDLAAARANSRTVLAGCAKLAALDPTVVNWHMNLKGRALTVAARLADASDRRARIDDLNAYLVNVRNFETAEPDLDEIRQIVIAAAELALGVLLAGDGRPDEATPHWRAAAARIQPYAEQGNLAALTVLAHARLRLGAIEEARRLARRIESTSYRHPAYTEFARLLSADSDRFGVQAKP